MPHQFNGHELPVLHSGNAAETGDHLSRFLASTTVSPHQGFAYAADIAGLHLGTFSLALVAIGVPAALKVRARGDHAVIVSCLQGSGLMHVDGRPVDVVAGHGFLAQPRSALTGDFSADCVRLVIRIDAGLLADYRPERETFQIGCPEMQPWFDQVRLLVTSEALVKAVQRDEAISHRMESLLAVLLQRTFLPALLAGQPRPIASRDVRRAEAHMRANLGNDLSMEDLARVAGVSIRTLQANFLRWRGVSPMSHLRSLRLESAQAKLLSGARVHEAAFASGFSHHGRFAHYYRERFGEGPSDTLRMQSVLLRPALS
jgi:AraC-like DNA-binding protein